MKIRNVPTHFEMEQAKAQWHQWYAWYPVRVGADFVCFETVERKGWHSLSVRRWIWEYRAQTQELSG